MAKIITINCNGGNYLDYVIPFLKSENPDIICFQEMIQENIPLFEKELQMSYVFTPMVYGMITGDPRLAGIAIFSKYPMHDVQAYYYRGTGFDFQTLQEDIPVESIYTFIQNAVLFAKIIIDQKEFFIANTHGPWTPDGSSTDAQLRDFDVMLEYLKKFPELILVGDFNAPRGNQSFHKIAQVFKDNVPTQYKASLDQDFHRAPIEQRACLMVDGFFSTSQYVVSDVRFVKKISDHMPIVATVFKK